jgi:hypothetical protein
MMDEYNDIWNEGSSYSIVKDKSNISMYAYMDV